MKTKSRIIDFEEITSPVEEDIGKLTNDFIDLGESEVESRKEINDLIKRVNELSVRMDGPVGKIPYLDEDWNELDDQLNQILKNDLNHDGFEKIPRLSTQDTIVCSLVGMLSVLIDVVFVGTPDVVKLYRGGEQFDGSIFTSALRKLGKDNSGKLNPLLQWLSGKCTVPYDISLRQNILKPNDHRLRSLSHDPFFGLFFAVADIVLGTTTCIDDSGNLTILFSDHKAPTTEKWLSVIYYLGHIISDLCTARGIPVPGFFVTQFFADEGNDKSISKIAESMYQNGYDVRHMASMGVPVFVKDMLLEIYMKIISEETQPIMMIAASEKQQLDRKLKLLKMKFVANSLATIGNTVKYMSPPSCGNPCALNLVQWHAFVQSSISMVVAETRDVTVERVLYEREEIDKKWIELLEFEK